MITMKDDLISRKVLCEYALNQKDKSVTPNDIMRFPSAQPDIIHCKDCTYFDTEWKPIHAEDNNYYCVINDGIWNINEHCSRAERKVTNENGKRN